MKRAEKKGASKAARKVRKPKVDAATRARVYTADAYHRKSMELIDVAMGRSSRLRFPLSDEARRAVTVSLGHEIRAAVMCPSGSGYVLPDGVLYRSAAWIAMDLELYATAMVLALAAWRRFPNMAPDIRLELHEVWEAAEAKMVLRK